MAEKLFINSYNALSVENPDCLKSSFSASANEIKITKFPFSNCFFICTIPNLYKYRRYNSKSSGTGNCPASCINFHQIEN